MDSSTVSGFTPLSPQHLRPFTQSHSDAAAARCVNHRQLGVQVLQGHSEQRTYETLDRTY